MDPAYLGLAGRITLLGVERILVKKLGTNASAASGALLFFFVGGLALLPFALMQNVESFAFAKGPILSGAVYALAFVCYFKSLAQGEASLVSPLYNFNILFLALLAWSLLGEPLTPFKGAGLLLLLYGASWLNRQGGFVRSLRAVFQDRACLLMIAASLLIAVGRIVDKHFVDQAPPVAYACLINFVIAGYLFLVVAARRQMGGTVRLARKKPWLVLVAGTINGYSYLLLLVALGGLEVSVAEPACMLGLIVTMLLSKWIFKEAIKERLIGAGIMILGVWCLFL